jgi:hypothetical protein
MITLKLEPEQIELLQAAVETMMELEVHGTVYGELADLQTLLIQTQENFYA